MPITMLPSPPLRDVLDDEEVLAGSDVAERPRFLHEHRERRSPLELLLKLCVLLLQLPHRRDPNRALRARVDEVVQRPVVQKPDEEQSSNREPAARDGAADAPAMLLLRSHPAPSSPGGAEVLRFG